MRRPGRRGDQVAVDVGLVRRNVDVLAAGQPHLRGAGRIGAARPPLQDAGGGQQLGAMADRGDRLARGVEVTHQSQHLLVQAQVFGGAAAGDQEGIVILGAGLGKVGIEGEVVARLLTVGLVAFEIVDGGAHALPGPLVRTHRMHLVAHHLQGLERDHGFVVFGIVADQHQDLLRSHHAHSFGQGPVIPGMHLR